MVAAKLELIFTPEELTRIKIAEDKMRRLLVIADVHGLKCHQAKRFINNIVNIIHSSFRLMVIHGYTHGTAIKDMLQQNFHNQHVQELFPDYRNQGVTHIIIAA